MLSSTVLVLAAALLAAAGASPRLRPRGVEVIQPFSEHLRSAAGDDDYDDRIYGGDEVKDIAEAPYHVGLWDAKKGFFCSGAIISEEWVITAGHCVDWTAGDIEVRAGSKSLSSPDSHDVLQKVKTTPADRTIHPNYDMDYLDNDIALIKAILQLVPKKVAPISLPWYGSAGDGLSGQQATITGWGRINDGSSYSQTNDILKRATIELSADTVCEAVYGNAMIGTKLCAATSAVSTCTGDSGGPVAYIAYTTQYLGGVVSFGHKDGCAKGMPVVFTRVSGFLEFIETTTGIVIPDNYE